MNCDKKSMLLYAVTDRSWVGQQTLLEQVEDALKNGVTCVQLREKELDDEAFLAEAIQMRKLCKKYNVPFIVNDHVDIAIKCGADGVHVGQEDMLASDVRKRIGDHMILGVSVHNVEEAVEAVKNGADYLGIGAVFNTSTKLNVHRMSSSMLRAICDVVNIPTVAIGGISAKNIQQLKGSGVDGIAVISAIFGAEDIGKATAKLFTLSCDMVKSHT